MPSGLVPGRKAQKRALNRTLFRTQVLMRIVPVTGVHEGEKLPKQSEILNREDKMQLSNRTQTFYLMVFSQKVRVTRVLHE